MYCVQTAVAEAQFLDKNLSITKSPWANQTAGQIASRNNNNNNSVKLTLRDHHHNINTKMVSTLIVMHAETMYAWKIQNTSSYLWESSWVDVRTVVMAAILSRWL